MTTSESDASARPPGLPRPASRRALALARRLLHTSSRAPGPLLRPILRAVFDALWISREGWEWAWRSFVATPLFLAQCESHGDHVSVDRMPYMIGRCRMRLGSNVRVSGLIGIQHSHRGGAVPLLSIGSGVFIGHRCSFTVANRIEVGDFVSIGGGTFITDTHGHSHRRLDRPIWEDPADSEDIAPVVIEDNVHIGRDCVILKGVRIGARAIIGAHSVVRSNIPPDALVAGNPARVAGWRTGAASASPGGARAGATPGPSGERESNLG